MPEARPGATERFETWPPRPRYGRWAPHVQFTSFYSDRPRLLDVRVPLQRFLERVLQEGAHALIERELAEGVDRRARLHGFLQLVRADQQLVNAHAALVAAGVARGAAFRTVERRLFVIREGVVR